MGMYNYLNGEQVKCFPVSTTHIDEYEDKVEICSMGGMLYSYRTGDKVPYRSLIYNYGENFIVFDYSWRSEETDEQMVHVIKGGILQGSYSLSEFNKIIQKDTLVINNHGVVLNIESTKDLRRIVDDYDKYIRKDYFGSQEFRDSREMFEDYINSVRDGKDDKELLKAYDKVIDELQDRTLNMFKRKWFSKEDKYEYTNIGYVIEQLLKSHKEPEYLTKMLKMYIRDCKDFDWELEEYKKWVGGYIKPEDIDTVIKTVLGENNENNNIN